MWAESVVEAGAIGAIVAVDGKVEAAGLACIDPHEAMAPSHRFRVGSIDKVFMAVVALQVLDDLDAPACRWLPEVDERITLRHLLTHRSGLFNWMLDGETAERLNFRDRAQGPPEELLRVALRYPLRRFGEVAYSNTNYTAVQLILERETGEALADLVRRLAIEPYGLRRTTMHEEPQLPDGVVHGYALRKGLYPVPSDEPLDASDRWADGSIVSDATDLESLFRQIDPSLPALRDYDGAYGHGGTMPGYTTLVLVNGSRVAVVAANSHSLPVSRAVNALARDLVLA